MRRWFNRLGQRNFAIGLGAITFLALWAIMASAFLPSRFDLKPGQVSRDLVRAPRTITFENKAETERERVQAADQVPKVYTYDPQVLPKVVDGVNGYFEGVAALLDQARAQAQAAGQPYNPVDVTGKISAMTPKVQDQTAATLAGLDGPSLDQMRSDVLNAVKAVLSGTVTDSSIATDRDRLSSLIDTTDLPADQQAAASDLGGAFLVPNNVYSADKTQQARQRAASDVKPVMVTVLNGETIVSPGQVVTEENVAALQALGLTGQSRQYGAIIGLGLLALVEVLIAYFYVRRFEKKIVASMPLQFILASLLVFFTLVARLTIIEPLSPLVLPAAALAMLGTFILGTRMSLILVMFLSTNLAVLSGADPQFLSVALMGGLVGTFLVSGVFQRRDLVRAGYISGAVVIMTAVAVGLLAEGSVTRVLSSVAWGAGNAVLTVMVTGGMLTFYEMLFNLPTPLKLLELADPTRPLLKELMMKAPGTYNHSIIMGNIAETAAEAIGANPLLARVGAYYHDIGKLNRPEYFIENQFHIKNPHDRLTPGLSRLAITAHVRDGVRLAREEGLPPEIVDIIKEHHGTTVLSYFYNKAKQGGGEIDEESYRYAGQKPESREAAIIMLADSVEAAVRSLRNPTMRNIKTVIRDIFEQRLRDGQLSASGMTFRDLERVRQVFEKSLKGFGATRIPYPEEVPARKGPRKAGAGRQAGSSGK